MIVHDTSQLRRYTGLLRRAGAGYAGHIEDAHGWRVDITARLVETDGTRFFELRGVPGALPADCRIGILDDPPDAAE
jgi:hypothetical protein